MTTQNENPGDNEENNVLKKIEEFYNQIKIEHETKNKIKQEKNNNTLLSSKIPELNFSNEDYYKSKNSLRSLQREFLAGSILNLACVKTALQNSEKLMTRTKQTA